jgi:hypothetical protein
LNNVYDFFHALFIEIIFLKVWILDEIMFKQ